MEWVPTGRDSQLCTHVRAPSRTRDLVSHPHAGLLSFLGRSLGLPFVVEIRGEIDWNQKHDVASQWFLELDHKNKREKVFSLPELGMQDRFPGATRLGENHFLSSYLGKASTCLPRKLLPAESTQKPSICQWSEKGLCWILQFGESWLSWVLDVWQKSNNEWEYRGFEVWSVLRVVVGP